MLSPTRVLACFVLLLVAALVASTGRGPQVRAQAVMVEEVGAAGGGDAGPVSPPYRHANLTVFFTRPSAPPAAGVPIYLPLAEAMRLGHVVVHETGDVNELAVENVSGQVVFVQQGDVVKGGKQDRVLASDLVLGPRSGRVAVPAFCVEQGRWRPRGAEKADRFASAEENANTPKLRAKASAYAPAAVGAGQSAVWSEVATAQRRLTEKAAADVAAAESPTSLQLTTENKKVAELRQGYLDAGLAWLKGHPGATGVVFAVDGRIVSADVYATPDLLAAMYPKLLKGMALEAAASTRLADVRRGELGREDAARFVAAAEDALGDTKDVSPRTRIVVREGEGVLRTETQDRGQGHLTVHVAVTAVEPERADAARRDAGEQIPEWRPRR